MLITLTVLAMFIGPLAGLGGGSCPATAKINVREQSLWIGGIWGWSFAALAGTLVGLIICKASAAGLHCTVFSILGLELNGAVWTGCVASIIACPIAVCTAGWQYDRRRQQIYS